MFAREKNVLPIERTVVRTYIAISMALSAHQVQPHPQRWGLMGQVGVLRGTGVSRSDKARP